MSFDLKSPKTIAVLVVAALVVLAAGVGVGYLIVKPSLDEAESKLAEAEDALSSLESSAPAESPTSEPMEEVESSGPEEPAPTSSPSTADDGRFPGIIKSIDSASGGGYQIVIDYVQVLGGAEANAAAAAHGDETPVPNDYYVVNDNPKLRTFPVSATCAVLMHDSPAADPMDGYIMGDVTITFDDFRVNRWGAQSYYRGAIYYITIVGGTITNIEHFWVP
jgi:pyruvate/2-oxoglutarate dehydrogenase complex dihydrolipoamide acyltransferase (E2) component